MTDHLIAPHGGTLVDLLVDDDRASDLKKQSADWPSWDLTPRQLCDLELLLSGGFSPLRGFLSRADYESVCDSMRLADGTLWPMPLTLDVPDDVAAPLGSGATLALRDPEGVMLAALQVSEVWQPDLSSEAQRVFGTTDPGHPGVSHLVQRTATHYVAGTLEGLQAPVHYDYRDLRLTPAEVRAQFAKLGWRRVVAFQTRNPLHRAHQELTLRAAKEVEANLLIQYEGELGVAMVPFRQMLYVEDLDTYVPEDEVPEGSRTLNISGTEQRRRLNEGRDLPEWFTPPAVATELRRSYPPRANQGFTVFFTGLSGSGKSTIANVLLVKLLEMGGRPVTLLDGDIVRKNLSSELGFSKEHRDINIRRIGYVASEITKNGGIAICAPIAPYDQTRRDVREAIEPGGGFLLVHIATPLEVCESRDRKGLYAKARAGIMKEFTGISDPYEEPADADVVIDTTSITPAEAAQEVILYLEREGYIAAFY